MKTFEDYKAEIAVWDGKYTDHPTESWSYTQEYFWNDVNLTATEKAELQNLLEERSKAIGQEAWRALPLRKKITNVIIGSLLIIAYLAVYPFLFAWAYIQRQR